MRSARFFPSLCLLSAKGQLMSTWARGRWPFWNRDSRCASPNLHSVSPGPTPTLPHVRPQLQLCSPEVRISVELGTGPAASAHQGQESRGHSSCLYSLVPCPPETQFPHPQNRASSGPEGTGGRSTWGDLYAVLSGMEPGTEEACDRCCLLN